MITSILVLGCGPYATSFVPAIKGLPGYKETDADADKMRVHLLFVTDMSECADICYDHETDKFGVLTVLKDGTEETELRTPIGDDLKSLIASKGHDTVVELEEYSQELADLILKLIEKNLTFYITNRELIRLHKEEFEEKRKGTRSKIFYYEEDPSLVEHLVSDISDMYDKKLKRYLENQRDLEMARNATPCGLVTSEEWNR